MQNKILRILFTFFIGYPLYAISFLFPRKKGRWVFGANDGFRCNSKFLFIDTIQNHSDIDAIWISRSKKTIKDINELGINNAYYYLSFKGFISLLTAEAYITNHDLHRTLSFWTLGRAKHVNLWHGVGIKNLRYQSTQATIYKINKRPILRKILSPITFPIFYTPDFFLATSPLMQNHFSKCFKIEKDNVLINHYPRNAPLCWSKDQLRNHLQKFEPKQTKKLIKIISSFSKTYIYMPTWREETSGHENKINLNLDILNDFLQQEQSLFILKLHPYVKKPKLDNKKHSNIIFLESNIDLYTVLPYTDVLITDYSSIYYDYLLMPDKNIILYPFDYHEYIENSRDLAFDYKTYAPSQKVYNFNELLNSLKNRSYKNYNIEEINHIKNLFWSNPNKINLVSQLKKRIYP